MKKLVVVLDGLNNNIYRFVWLDDHRFHFLITSNKHIVGNINESLFDYVGDQTLIIENQKVIIDEFYVDMIKEYVDGK